MSKKFALVGAAGYIAPKHMEAIKTVGGDLVAVLDPHDSVGILDRYFPNTHYFRDVEQFQRHLGKTGVDYISICTPNYLHDYYMKMSLNLGANAICEKPLVINPDNLGPLKDLEQSTGRRIYPILQLRYHPVIQKLKKWIEVSSTYLIKPYITIINYQTYRGPWYQYSWKGNPEQSGGLAYNIGIHLFDMLVYLYGKINTWNITKKTMNEIDGYIQCGRGNVNFYLNLWSKEIRRTIEINRETYDMNFENAGLHNICYQEILAGRGLSIQDTEASLWLAHRIENGG